MVHGRIKELFLVLPFNQQISAAMTRWQQWWSLPSSQLKPLTEAAAIGMRSRCPAHVTVGNARGQVAIAPDVICNEGECEEELLL